MKSPAQLAESVFNASLLPGQDLEAKDVPQASLVPDYLSEVYNWAYLDPTNVRLLDRELVVKVILWGQHDRLRNAAFSEIKPGQRVYQPTHVYGDFCPALARHLGSEGRLVASDVAPVQVANGRWKLQPYPWASMHRADAIDPPGDQYDVTLCYFLLHEIPEDYKRDVVDTLLDSVAPGGKLVFIDYHKPHPLHPLKLITSLVFDTLEPFAKSLWHHEIKDFASRADDYEWRQETFFGGLFQKVVAERKM
jgi:ubiquinone/menaquinone biosynthesis C-methylase UbiE